MMALACGLAIMLAGAVFLFQLTTQDDLAEPVPIGEPVVVGDMEVTVTDTEVLSAGTLTVLIEIGGTVDELPTDGFRMIASGRPVTVEQTTCLATNEASQTCTVTFDVSSADGVSRVLFYDRGDDQARWVLG